MIPPGRGGFGEIVANAPLLLERLATLTEQLNVILGPENQEQLSGILANSNRLTRELADAAPRLESTFGELEVALKESSEALDAFEKVSLTTNQLLDAEGPKLARELSETLTSANQAATSLSAMLEDARPATQALSETTLPTVEATLQDLRATSRSLRAITDRLEAEGARSLIGGRPLPEYKP